MEDDLEIPLLSHDVELTREQKRYIRMLKEKEITHNRAVVALPCGSGKSLIILSHIMEDLSERLTQRTEPTLLVTHIPVCDTFIDEINSKFNGKIKNVKIGSDHSKGRIGNNHIDNAILVLVGFDMLSTIHKEMRRRRIEIFQKEKDRFMNEFRDWVDKNVDCLDIFNTLEKEKERIEKVLSKDRDKLKVFLDIYNKLVERMAGLDSLIDAFIKSPKLRERIPAPFEYLNEEETKERRDKGYQTLYDRTFHRLVVDEAHEARESKMSYCEAITDIKAKNRIMMSGTPINNNIQDIYAMLKMMHCQEYIPDSPVSVEVLKQVREKYFIIPPPSIYSSIKDKYKTTEIICYLDFMEQKERSVYDEIKRKVLTSTEMNVVFPSVSKLRRACDASVPSNVQPTKLNAVVEYIKQVVMPRDEKVVVFSNYISSVNRLADLCAATFNYKGSPKHLAIFKITGQVLAKNRNDIMHKFDKWGGPAILICTQKTIATGTNLVAANHIILLHRWWNPQAAGQAVERIRRITQRKSTFIVHMIMKGTVEEGIFCVESSKNELNINFLTGNINEGMLKKVNGKEVIMSNCRYEEGDEDMTALNSSDMFSIFNDEITQKSIKTLLLQKADIVVTNTADGVVDFSEVPPTTFLPIEVMSAPCKRNGYAKDYVPYFPTEEIPPPVVLGSTSKRPRLITADIPCKILEPKKVELPPIPDRRWMTSRPIKTLSLDVIPTSSSLNYFKKAVESY
jgi:SNF2 family DNA or RNA helicase